jgi:hypothetical protein
MPRKGSRVIETSRVRLVSRSSPTASPSGMRSRTPSSRPTICSITTMATSWARKPKENTASAAHEFHSPTRMASLRASCDPSQPAR